jgi:hypothetical protein
MTVERSKHKTQAKDMSRREALVVTMTLAAAWALGSMPGLAPSPAKAQSAKLPNMPAKNPYLTDSVFPVAHFNPGATDAVAHAGVPGAIAGKFTVSQKSLWMNESLNLSRFVEGQSGPGI